MSTPTTTNTAKATPDGLTIRDYMAAKAMAALIDGYDYEARERSAKRSERTGFDDLAHRDGLSDATYASMLAEESYIIADEMLRVSKSIIPARYVNSDLLAACVAVRDKLLDPMAREWPGTMSIAAREVEELLNEVIARSEGTVSK